MPPAVAAAGIAAAGTLGGTALASRSAGRATNAQMKANADALQYEREREQARKAAYDQTMAQRQQAFDAWYKRVGDEGIKRYGVPTGLTIPGTVGGLGTPAPKSGAVPFGAPAPRAAPMGGPPMAPAARPQGATLADMMGQIPNATAVPMTPLAAPEGQNLAQLGGWNDWEQYLNKGRA
jgi:hypothetical protein